MCFYSLAHRIYSKKSYLKVNFSFTIELVEFGKKCHIYTIRVDGEEYNEFDKFLLDDKMQAHPEFESLMVRISSIAHKIGAQDQFFKLHESTSTEAIVALCRCIKVCI